MGCADVLATASRLSGYAEAHDSMAEPIMKASSFATAEEGVEHFFGTKQFRVDVRPGDTVPPDPLPLDCHRPSAWLSVKQVHGTDVLVIDRPVQTGETFH